MPTFVEQATTSVDPEEDVLLSEFDQVLAAPFLRAASRAARSLPESLCPQILSPDAVGLISEVFESYAVIPHCGWATLARVEQVLSRERQPRLENRGSYDWITLERLIVRFMDGSEGVLQCWYRGYAEGFECQIEQIA